MTTHHRRNVNNPFANNSRRTVGYSDHRYGNPHHHNQHHRGRKGFFRSPVSCVLMVVGLIFLSSVMTPSAKYDDLKFNANTEKKLVSKSTPKPTSNPTTKPTLEPTAKPVAAELEDMLGRHHSEGNLLDNLNNNAAHGSDGGSQSDDNPRFSGDEGFGNDDVHQPGGILRPEDLEDLGDETSAPNHDGETSAPKLVGNPGGETSAPQEAGIPGEETSAPNDDGNPDGETSAPQDAGIPASETSAPGDDGNPDGETSAPQDAGNPGRETSAPEDAGQAGDLTKKEDGLDSGDSGTDVGGGTENVDRSRTESFNVTHTLVESSDRSNHTDSGPVVIPNDDKMAGSNLTNASSSIIFSNETATKPSDRSNHTDSGPVVIPNDDKMDGNNLTNSSSTSIISSNETATKPADQSNHTDSDPVVIPNDDKMEGNNLTNSSSSIISSNETATKPSDQSNHTDSDPVVIPNDDNMAGNKSANASSSSMISGVDTLNITSNGTVSGTAGAEISNKQNKTKNITMESPSSTSPLIDSSNTTNSTSPLTRVDINTVDRISPNGTTKESLSTDKVKKNSTVTGKEKSVRKSEKSKSLSKKTDSGRVPVNDTKTNTDSNIASEEKPEVPEKNISLSNEADIVKGVNTTLAAVMNGTHTIADATILTNNTAHQKDSVIPQSGSLSNTTSNSTISTNSTNVTATSNESELSGNGNLRGSIKN